MNITSPLTAWLELTLGGGVAMNDAELTQYSWADRSFINTKPFMWRHTTGRVMRVEIVLKTAFCNASGQYLQSIFALCNAVRTASIECG